MSCIDWVFVLWEKKNTKLLYILFFSLTKDKQSTDCITDRQIKFLVSFKNNTHPAHLTNKRRSSQWTSGFTDPYNQLLYQGPTSPRVGETFGRFQLTEHCGGEQALAGDTRRERHVVAEGAVGRLTHVSHRHCHRLWHIKTLNKEKGRTY